MKPVHHAACFSSHGSIKLSFTGPLDGIPLAAVLFTAVLLGGCGGGDGSDDDGDGDATDGPSAAYRLLHQDILINADLWRDTPQILSASYAFEGIIGVDDNEEAVRAAGGTWNQAVCTSGAEPDVRALTSSPTPQGVAATFGYPVYENDALPVVFSWPLLPSTLDPTDFRLTLNTGERVFPNVASISPNLEYNERHVAVIFGEFGNRLPPGADGAVYPTGVEIVEDDTPLMLVGPDGPVSAVGLTWTGGHGYVSGPTLVGAKLSHLNTMGEGAPALFAGQLPNDGATLYGPEARYRLRVYTSGGFSADGVRSVLPDEFSRFFRLHVSTASGGVEWLTQTGVDYVLEMGRIRILGLADLGLPAGTVTGDDPPVAYDDCYIEDHDNYIDIVLAGDEAAMRRITHVEIPADGVYSAFYNPGGPGNDPTPGVTYTAPGPADLEPVIMALDDPMTVTYGAVPETHP